MSVRISFFSWNNIRPRRRTLRSGWLLEWASRYSDSLDDEAHLLFLSFLPRVGDGEDDNDDDEWWNWIGSIIGNRFGRRECIRTHAQDKNKREEWTRVGLLWISCKTPSKYNWENEGARNKYLPYLYNKTNLLSDSIKCNLEVIKCLMAHC